MDSDYGLSHALTSEHLTKYETLSRPVSLRNLTFTKDKYQGFLYIIKMLMSHNTIEWGLWEVSCQNLIRSCERRLRKAFPIQSGMYNSCVVWRRLVGLLLSVKRTGFCVEWNASVISAKIKAVKTCWPCENRLLRKTFGLKRQEVRGDWTKLHN
jgi:hypothetical protein